jgi:hypothetical protein
MTASSSSVLPISCSPTGVPGNNSGVSVVHTQQQLIKKASGGLKNRRT